MIRAGVVGAGNMGSNHARVYASLTADATLTGVFDPDRDRARAVAERWGARAFQSIEALLEAVDVVTIASPSALHHEHLQLALDHGVDVLVEKPLAHSVDAARELESLVGAHPGAPVVQVGHIEHFNPAIVELRKLVSHHEPIAIDMRRLGPFDRRIFDIDVVQDLMLHDVHVLLTLARSPLASVHASGRCVPSEDHTDHAVATLTFEDGLIATLAASRITEDKIRRLTVTARDAHVSLDSVGRSLEVSRWTSLQELPEGASSYRQESTIARVSVPIEEPLVAQIRSFLGHVAARTEPDVPVSMGVACLEVIEQIRTEIAANAPAGALAGV